MQDKTAWIRAGFGPRAAAFLLDQLLVAIALLVVKVPAWLVRLFAGQPMENVLFSFSLLDVLCYLLLSAYFVLLTYLTGSTLGKKVMGIKVVRGTGEELRFVDVLYRETIGRYLSGVLFVGYLMALVDRQKRAFHDYLCETCVVYDHKREKTSQASEPAPAESGASEEPAIFAGYTVPGGSRSSSAEPVPVFPELLPAGDSPCEGDEAVNTLPPAEKDNQF